VTIPFLDVAAAYLQIQADIESVVIASLRSGQYIGGPDVDAFEEEFAALRKPSIVLASSTGSMHCTWHCLP
jgi:dTDP-4-amino-4,6-dideoxygalactose transaminase